MSEVADRLYEIFAEIDRISREITNLPYVDATGVPTDDANEHTLAAWEKLNAQYNALATEAARIVNKPGHNQTKTGR